MPVSALPENASFHSVTKNCKSMRPRIAVYEGGEWNHQEFFSHATRAQAGEFDLFMMDGKTLVIPCQNEFFEYTGTHTLEIEKTKS